MSKDDEASDALPLGDLVEAERALKRGRGPLALGQRTQRADVALLLRVAQRVLILDADDPPRRPARVVVGEVEGLDSRG